MKRIKWIFQSSLIYKGISIIFLQLSKAISKSLKVHCVMIILIEPIQINVSSKVYSRCNSYSGLPIPEVPLRNMFHCSDYA